MTPDIEFPAISREYVYVPVPSFRDGATTDPTGLPVDAALVAVTAKPATADWKVVDWAPYATSPTARALVGLGGTLDPGAGLWGLWLRIRGAVEQPVVHVATIRLT